MLCSNHCLMYTLPTHAVMLTYAGTNGVKIVGELYTVTGSDLQSDAVSVQLYSGSVVSGREGVGEGRGGEGVGEGRGGRGEGRGREGGRRGMEGGREVEKISIGGWRGSAAVKEGGKGEV